jgi:hypothetical protein
VELELPPFRGYRHPLLLATGTLTPGQLVKGAVEFELQRNDAPTRVSLIVPWSQRIRVTWR